MCAVVHTYNPSTFEVKVGEEGILIEFEASLGYER